jgi:UDPglucose 6-dehydrogenase
VKIGVAGLWHLGVMYAVGFAELQHEVIAYDPSFERIQEFRSGVLHVFEPGLQEMMLKNIERGKLKFTNNENELRNAELFVLAYDTPVDDGDNANVDYVLSEFGRIARYLNSDTEVMVSSQLPVGTAEKITAIFRGYGGRGAVVVQPENLRLGKAIASFFNPGRIIAGTQDGHSNEAVLQAFHGIQAPIIWMHSQSAEISKHALNAFLAMSVTFMGEISQICETVGADAKEVEIALRSDLRIGQKAYLSPGLGFAGGTLARDVKILANLQSGIRKDNAILTSLLASNRFNNDWVNRKLKGLFPVMEGLKFCFWGVSYVENTDTLRRSEIYELMKDLVQNGVEISFVENFPLKGVADAKIVYIEEAQESLKEIDVLIVSKKLVKTLAKFAVRDLLRREGLWILDPSRILLELVPELLWSPTYLTVGMGG